jgi:pimeloyl-ACP methyl ester carboxylesterase
MAQTFVLVHGGWCWSRVAALLRADGHRVFTPTLTGLGERAHLLTPEVGPATMIRDVEAVLEHEELDDVVLVGHSFGALVALGVADRARERLRRLVLLDGLVVDAGRAGLDVLAPEVGAARVEQARRHGDGLAIPAPSSGSVFGLADPDDLAWVERRLTPHPLRSYTEPLALRHPLGNGLEVTYLRCTDPPYPAIAAGLDVVRRVGWPCRDLATGHDGMISAPGLVAAELTA